MRAIILAVGILLSGITVSVPQATAHTSTLFVLSNEITGRSIFQDEYGDLIRTLDNAKKGDEVIIVLNHNRGGRISSMLDIIAAMARTKATVWTKSVGAAHSCAMDILLFGDVVLIQKGVMDLAHLTSNNRWNISMRDYLIVKLKYFKKFLSSVEYEKFNKHEDVWVPTTDMCDRVGQSSKLDGYCVVYNRRL